MYDVGLTNWDLVDDEFDDFGVGEASVVAEVLDGNEVVLGHVEMDSYLVN